MQMQPPSPYLAASNLACRRGDRLLFRKLTLTMEAGSALHITGANGTGKTTLMREISNYEIEGFPVHVRVVHVEQEVIKYITLLYLSHYNAILLIL